MIELSFRDLDLLELVTRTSPEHPREIDERSTELDVQGKVDALMRHLQDLNARLSRVIEGAASLPVAIIGSPEAKAQPPPLNPVSLTLSFADVRVLAGELHRSLPRRPRRRRTEDSATRVIDEIEKHQVELYRKVYVALQAVERKTAARMTIAEE